MNTKKNHFKQLIEINILRATLLYFFDILTFYQIIDT